MRKELILKHFWDRIQQHRLLTGEVICFFIFVFVIFFQNDSLSECYRLLQESESLSEIYDRNQRNADGINLELGILNSNFQKIQDKLLNVEEKTELLRFFLDATKWYNIEMESIGQPISHVITKEFPFEINGAVKNKELLKVTYQLRIQGRFKDVLQFISFIQKEKFIGKVFDISFREGKSPEVNSCSIFVSFLGVMEKS